jgi:hypothetical protein
MKSTLVKLIEIEHNYFKNPLLSTPNSTGKRKTSISNSTQSRTPIISLPKKQKPDNTQSRRLEFELENDTLSDDYLENDPLLDRQITNEALQKETRKSYSIKFKLDCVYFYRKNESMLSIKTCASLLEIDRKCLRSWCKNELDLQQQNSKDERKKCASKNSTAKYPLRY